MSEYVTLEVEEGVALVTLNRPERANAIGADLGAQLDQAWADLYVRSDVRVVVLTGAGKVFCAGADMDRLTDLASGQGDTSNLLGYLAGESQPVFDVIEGPLEVRTRYGAPRALPVPVIGALNGAAIGAGLLLAMNCDIRFASANAFLMAGFTRRGLVAELGLPWLLATVAGTGVATEMLLSGRRMDADEAERKSIVTKVFSPESMLDEVMTYARELASHTSPRSVRLIKQQLHDLAGQGYGDAFRASVPLILESMESFDFREGIASYLEKRPPEFRGE